MKFPAKALDRLAELVINGDVVFFVGAGFSIDVENNTAVRLIRRLLIRLWALTSSTVYGDAQEGLRLRRNFESTFFPDRKESEKKQQDEKVPNSEPAFPFDKRGLELLAFRYYEVNEWFVNTLGYLLREVFRDEKAAAARLTALTDEERSIQQGLAALEPVELEPIDPDLIKWAREKPDHPAPGKALFLDTLGFRNAHIMRGRPLPPPGIDEELFEKVEDLFHGGLLPRHRVLARFAREGWCPTTITTNYDLLLEGAFRLSGFAHKKKSDEFPPTRFRCFARIASPVEFFTDGKALREPVLIKMHGCAERYRRWSYRDVNEKPELREKFKAYLRSMVFTYREIQNWRGDSWAADFLRTQLRTRTVVFCGYSLQDPVIHDTFRTVYEEMAKIRRDYGADDVLPHELTNGATTALTSPQPTSTKATANEPSPGATTTAEEKAAAEPKQADTAPAYFFAPGADKQEFYGLEVLQAASLAFGAKRAPFGHHPNYLRFNFRNRTFSNLDEQFSWLFHRAVRAQQREDLQNNLHRIASVWLGKPRPDDELEAIRAALRAIAEAERVLACTWSDQNSARARSELERVVAWTEYFHSGLLREFSCGDLVQQWGGPGTRLARIRRAGWYYPVTENPYWTGWGAVVEIALRRMAADLAGKRDQFTAAASVRPEALLIGKCARPTVLFAILEQATVSQGVALPPRYQATRRALTIHYAGFGMRSRQAPVVGAVFGRTFWELRPADGRWLACDSELAQARRTRVGPGCWSSPVPDPRIIWRWAVGRETEEDQECARQILDDDADHSAAKHSKAA